MTIWPFASIISPSTLITTAEWLNKLDSHRNFLKYYPLTSEKWMSDCAIWPCLTFCNCTPQCACLGTRSAPVSARNCSCIQCCSKPNVHALSCQCKDMQLYTVLFNARLCIPCPVSARKCIPGQKCLRPAHSAGWQRQLLLIFLFPPPTSVTLTSQCNASEIHVGQTFGSAYHFTIA